MDIASLSTAMSMSKLSNDISVAVMSKQLDMVQVMGDSMIKALEQSVTPNLGANVDVSI